MDHEAYMRDALEQARQGMSVGEVPIGAVLVSASGERIAADYNRPIRSCDPTAHAEVLVLRRAAEAAQNYRLPGSTVYATVEPCLMCLGALVNARVSRLVYGASEPKFGAVTSLLDFRALRVTHRIEVLSGVLEEECSALLVDFFRARRERG
jgi:tRNA(adenine34) deaminase